VFISMKWWPTVAVDQELDRAGAFVGGRAHRGQRARGEARRSAASTAGDGASSISFWWRR
jgi:hypothetical protein